MMLRFFKKSDSSAHKKIFSNILFHCDEATLEEIKTVSTYWHTSATTMINRKNLYQTILMNCDYFTNIQILSFDMDTLSGGLTNSNFKITITDQSYVARLPGKNTKDYINREAEFTNASLASQCGINAKILYYDVKTGAQVTVFLTNPLSMTNKIIKKENYLNLALQALSTIHQSSNKFQDDIDIFERNILMLNIIRYGENPLLNTYFDLAVTMDEIKQNIHSLNMPKVPCHNDTTPTNFIFSENRMYIIDWEYSGNNYAIWDLVCLALEAKFNKKQINNMLNKYYGANLTQEIRHIFEVLKPVYHYWGALWCAVQMKNFNLIDGEEGLIDMEKNYLVNCKKAINSSSFKDAMEYLQPKIEDRIAFRL